MCEGNDLQRCRLCAAATKKISRENTNSKKWDECAKFFSGKKVVPLWIADSDFQAPAEVVQVIKKRAEHPVFGYGSKPAEFYEAARLWFLKQHGWNIDSSWMQTTPGVIPALASCVQAYTLPGDEVIIQPPVFPNFYTVVKNLGRNLVENPLINSENDYRMDFVDLREKISSRTKMLILCNPHNPGGRVWRRDELQELADICIERGVLMVSDELNCDLTLFGNKYTPLAALNTVVAENTVTCVAPSKTFNLAGLSTSLTITANEALREKLRMAIEGYGLYETNNFGIVAFEAAYRTGEKWLEALRCYYEKNAVALKIALENKQLPITMQLPQSSFTAWLDCRKPGLSDAQLSEIFVDYCGVGVNMGTRYGVQGSGFVRLNFGCRREFLIDTLEKIAGGFARYFA